MGQNPPYKPDYIMYNFKENRIFFLLLDLQQIIQNFRDIITEYVINNVKSSISYQRPELIFLS